jgi:hypothetical protein
MDITKATQPNSQQINADDLDEPIVVTVTGAAAGNDEQPLHISVAEFPGRTYRPSTSMARVIKAAWGKETDNWTGTRRLELFCNPTIKFGPAVVGGIQISKISHIDGPLKVNLTTTRGKKAFFTVQPLATVTVAPTPPPADTSGRIWLDELALAGDDIDAVQALGTAAKEAHATAADIGPIREKYKQLEAAQ